MPQQPAPALLPPLSASPSGRLLCRRGQAPGAAGQVSPAGPAQARAAGPWSSLSGSASRSCAGGTAEQRGPAGPRPRRRPAGTEPASKL